MGIAAVTAPAGSRSPRRSLVLRIWQCDKKNHGWREGPPVTVSWQSFDLLAGPSPSRQNQLRTKKEYTSVVPAVRSSIRTLAALKRRFARRDWLGRLRRAQRSGTGGGGALTGGDFDPGRACAYISHAMALYRP